MKVGYKNSILVLQRKILVFVVLIYFYERILLLPSIKQWLYRNLNQESVFSCTNMQYHAQLSSYPLLYDGNVESMFFVFYTKMHVAILCVIMDPLIEHSDMHVHSKQLSKHRNVTFQLWQETRGPIQVTVRKNKKAKGTVKTTELCKVHNYHKKVTFFGHFVASLYKQENVKYCMFSTMQLTFSFKIKVS